METVRCLARPQSEGVDCIIAITWHRGVIGHSKQHLCGGGTAYSRYNMSTCQERCDVYTHFAVYDNVSTGHVTEVMDLCMHFDT